MGFELLDQEQPLGTSQFMETARYRRSLEGELARTISSISIVRQARVHLAMPKSTVFIRDQRKPTASVLVDLFPGTNLTREQVSAIANLVASSVPELSLSDVAVVDQKGNLLSKFEDENDELAEAEKHMKYARKLEQEMAERIERILTPVVGSGKFRAEVSADIDFTEVEQTDEVFNPDLPAVRSEQTLDEQKVGAGLDGGIPGALTNQPPGVGDAPEQVAGAGADGGAGGPVNTRKQATRNYELDRTISYTKHQVGRVRRLTVAVVVDDIVTQNAETGEVNRQAWDDNELQRLAILVRDAVGFDPARGDSVNVINSPFVEVEGDTFEYQEPPIWEQPWFQKYMQWILSGLGVLLVYLIGIRPISKGLVNNAEQAREAEQQRALAAAGVGEMGDEGGEAALGLSGGDSLLLPSPSESYEQQLNAVKGMIAEDPGRVAQVIKQWVNQGE
jgi:flagellar M-ring protein FliF